MQNKSLDFTPEKFESLLNAASQLVLDRFKDLDDAPGYSGLTPQVVRQWFDEPVPQEGMDIDELLSIVKEKVMDTATMNMGTNMYAYVMAGGTQVSILSELLVATINQNVGKWHLAPVMSELERRVVQWGAQFMGYDSDAGGVLVSGGSAANLTGLTVARNVFFQKEDIRNKGLFGFKPFIVYASNEVHGCIDKSIELLGIGMDNYRKIPTNYDHSIDIELLKKQIIKDKQDGFTPFCLIGNAGTVNTGAIDDLNAMADITELNNMWFHVDGAYGGLAGALEEIKPLYKGIERADSIAIDFHKWLYQPFEAGCTLVKDWSELRQTFYKKATYLSTDTADDGRFDFNEHHFQLSRSAKALKIWMSYKAYGANKIKEMIAKDIELTRYLKNQLDNKSHFEVINDPQLAIICFRYLGRNDLPEDRIDELNKKIIPALEKDGRVFITGTTLYNRPVIRACLINHRLKESNIDHLIKVIEEVGHSVEEEICQVKLS